MGEFIDKILDDLICDCGLSYDNRIHIKEALVEYASACLMDSKVREELEKELGIYDYEQE